MSSPNRRVSGQINELLFHYNLHGDVNSPEAPSPLHSPHNDNSSTNARLSESSSIKASEYAQGRRSWASKDLNGDRSSVADMVTEYWSSRQGGMFESDEQATHSDYPQENPSGKNFTEGCDQSSVITERPVGSYDSAANAQASKNPSPKSQENDRVSSAFHSFEEDPDDERQSRWQRHDRWKRTGIVAPPYSCCPRCDKLYYCPFCVTWSSSSTNNPKSDGSSPPSVLMLSERNSMERIGDRRITRGVTDDGNNRHGDDNFEQSLVIDRSSTCWSFALPESSEKIAKKREPQVGTLCEGGVGDHRYRESATPSRKLSDLLTASVTAPFSSSPPTQPTESRRSRMFNKRLKRKRPFLMANNRSFPALDQQPQVSTPMPIEPTNSDSSNASRLPVPTKLGSQEPLTASSEPSPQHTLPATQTPVTARDVLETKHGRAGSARYSLFRVSSDEPGKSMAERILHNKPASTKQTQPGAEPSSSSSAPAGATGSHDPMPTEELTCRLGPRESRKEEAREKTKTSRRNLLARFFRKMWPATFSRDFPPKDPGTGLRRKPLPPPDRPEAFEVEEAIAGPSQSTKAKGKQRRQSQQLPRRVEDGELQKIFKGEALPDLRRTSFEMDGVSCSNCGYTKFVKQDGACL